jgi:hypothetical protein
MTTIIDGTSGITFPNSTVQASAGQVLQVVSASTSTAVSNATTTYIDTGLTATITPKFTTSKILVLISQNTYKTAGANNNSINIKLFRDATDLGRIIYVQGYTGTAIDLYSQAATQFLDSPNTTSAVTYKTQFANLTATSSAVVQGDGLGLSTITLMEIAA